MVEAISVIVAANDVAPFVNRACADADIPILQQAKAEYAKLR